MYGPLKISQHQHSGRLRPHEHTSYLALAGLIIVAGLALMNSSLSTVLADHPPPQAGSIGLTGTVPATPPNTAAVITSPTDQQHFSTSPITVSGTCPTGTLVEIYKNDIFAGSAPCGSDGKFSMEIDLLYGTNSLTAQVYDVLNQAGPVSTAVTVYYNVSAIQSAPLSLLNFEGTQLLLSTDSVYRGSFPDQNLNVPITIIGGTPPFAVNVQWGDANNKVIPRGDNTIFNASHAYQRAGTYQIDLQAADSQQRVAFLTVAAIINGQPSVISASSNKSSTNKFLLLWPLYAIAATLVASFWMGERREKRILAATTTSQIPSSGLLQ
ncbi:MAG TPA: hypothetical protein VEH48_00590 [Candidatus Nitrosopolaris sp.]|nr:hypothetical protein [Candidatus Nitrosopolaris sp.]